MLPLCIFNNKILFLGIKVRILSYYTYLYMYLFLVIVYQRKFAKYSQMLKTNLNTKISTLKVFNLNLYSYLCGQYLTILKKKSHSVFHLTSGYNIGR